MNKTTSVFNPKTFVGSSVRRFGAAAALASMLSACAGAAVSPTGAPTVQTATDRAIGQCVATVAGGAIIGALIGKDRKSGALIGAGIGAGACAVLLQVASREDKARIAAAEQEALRANASRTVSFQTTSGKQATVSTRVASVKPPKRSAPVVAAAPSTPTAVARPAPVVTAAAAEPSYTACRYATQTITVDGQSSDESKQLWCRVDTGDWQAVAG
jgi:surface antigen